LVPNGLVALFGYGTPTIGEADDEVETTSELNSRFMAFYDQLRWPPDRRHIETRYENLVKVDSKIRQIISGTSN
jgi:hypothetical protein